MEQGTRAEGDATLVNLQILLEAFLNMSLRSACFTNAAFFNGKKQNFRSWDYSPQVVDFQINRRRIKGILMYILRFQKYLNFAPEIYLTFLEINILKKLNICKALCTKDHHPFQLRVSINYHHFYILPHFCNISRTDYHIYS